jgi:tetratricopeptide (TPR) repeat protein
MARRRRRDDDYGSYEVPWFRRVLDDTFGTLFGMVIGFFKAVGLVLWLTLTAPLRWMGFIQTSLDEEGATHRTSNALLGIPAVLVGGALLALVIAVAITPAATLGDRYRVEAQKAAKDGDTKKALLLYSRLRLLESGNPETTFELALVQDKIGRRDLARSLMMQIAPTDTLGYPQAHAWLASQLVHSRSSPQEVEVARTHLLRLLQLAPDHPQANALMAQLDVRSGRYAEAEQRLRTAIVGNPSARLILAKLLARVFNRKDDAKIEAGEVKQYFEAVLRQKPDDHATRESLAETYMLLADYDKAAALMKEGETLFPNNSYREKLALVYADWATTLPRGDAKRWQVLGEAFKNGPATPGVLGTLLKISLDDKGDEQSLRATLEPIRQAKDAQAGSAEMLLGLLSVHRGKSGEATIHFKKASELESRSASLAAMTIEAARLSPQSMVDLTAALKTAWPDRPELRRFHGIALAASGRMAESLVELEQLANEGRRDATLFDTLAEVTSRLGLQEKSDRYKKQALELSPFPKAADKDEKGKTP